MTERPGDDAGYPPAPAPRAEPFTVDDADDDEAPGPAPLAWSSPGDRDEVPRRAPYQAPGATWRPRPPASGWAPQPAPAGTPQDAASRSHAAPPQHGASAPYGQPASAAGSSPSTTPQYAAPAPQAGASLPPAQHGRYGAPEHGGQQRPAAPPWPSSAPRHDEHSSQQHSSASQPWGGAGDHPWQSVDGPDRHGSQHGPEQGPGRTPRRRGRRTVGLGVVVLLVLVALLGGIVLGALGARQLFDEPTTSLPGPSGQAPVDRAPGSVAAIAAAALESTVFIEVAGGGVGSSGSGMVLREDGYLVTNNHVIAAGAEGDGRVTVTFADGGQERAEIVGRTSDYDLAVLKVDREGLTPLPLADSDAVVVGDTAIAVGAPLGLEGTVTTGIISALNRPVQAGAGGDGTSSFINAIQTDAAINPGNSGGPLINGSGEVIGINTAIAQASGRQTGSIGLGFAIPSNQVRRTAEQIIETGEATYPVIGVALDTRYQGEGVRVIEDGSSDTPAVTPGGPADAAGIEPGAVITRFDGQPVTSPQELIVAVRSRAPGDTVVLTVRSDGRAEREVEVVLDEAVSE